MSKAKAASKQDQWQRIDDYLLACDFPVNATMEVNKLAVEFLEAGAPQPKRWAASMNVCNWNDLYLTIDFGAGLTVTLNTGVDQSRRSLRLDRRRKANYGGNQNEQISDISDALCAQLVKVFCGEVENS